MKLVLVTLRTSSEPWAEEASAQYSQKIGHFLPFQVQHLKPQRRDRSERTERMSLDSAQLLDFFRPDDFVLLFDERGKSFTSEQFAKTIEGVLGSGKKRLVFVVGGAYGVDETVRRRAQIVVSMAPFVLNHVVAQVVALEQIYRAFTIIRNLPYHNQ